MNLYEHPDHFIQRFNEERERSERRAEHLRALRGPKPQVDDTVRDRAASTMAGDLAPAHPCLEGAVGGRP